TAGKPAKIELVADRSAIKANGTDLSFVTVKITDEAGNLVPGADNLVKFKLDGVGSIAGVDNGFQASLEPFKANYRKAYNGLCLAIIQATETAGTVKLTATAEGLKSAELVIKTGK
ncbi:MAG: glycoside hydrolase family 2, partial [Proteobacteria bacterium]